MQKIKVTVEKTNTGFSAGADKYPVYTAGDTLPDILGNIVEALNLYFEDKGKTVTENDIALTLDIASFFEFYNVINAKGLSKRIGMNQSLLAQYIKGHKKPSSSQTHRILKGVQQVGRELAEIRFLL
ncbi:MAG: XRE family transcriptional regulator [Bacteroidetes bacterium]|nr:XRE family transcriptional regulator [Bacteroidota bacterium]